MGIVTVRPDSVTLNQDVTNVGGAADLAAATSDDSDATYGRFDLTGTSGSVLAVQVAAHTLAAGERVKRIRGRLRVVNGTTGSGNGRIKPSLWFDFFGGSATELGNWEMSIGATAPDDPVDRSGPWIDLPDDARTQQATLDALHYIAGNNTNNDRVWRLHELYVDVDVWARTDAPTVTIAEASAGTVSTTDLPTVQAYTAAANDGTPSLWSRQVRVFRDEVYTAGGFDPATEDDVEWEDNATSLGGISTASGDPDAVQADTPMANGDTYRAYVRYGKNGVSGQTLWSEWSYAEFTLSLTLPGAPTVAVTVDQVEGRQTVEVTTAALTHDTLDAIRVQRSDDDGATWATIRDGYITDDPYDGSALAGGTAYTFHDYDAPRDAELTYRARVTEGITASGTSLTSPWDAPSSVLHPNDGQWWLYDVDRWTSVIGGARIVEGPEVEVAADVGVFYPLGRDGSAVVVSGTVHGDDGTYELRATGTDECADVDAIVRHTGTVLVKSPFGDQKYVRWVSRRRGLRGVPDLPRHLWTVGYAQVAADVGSDG